MHRDIKSENVFRTDCGTWKLGDFGSALKLADRSALERQVLKLEGTFSFAAPEYVRIWKGFQRSQLVEATDFKARAAGGCVRGWGGSSGGRAAGRGVSAGCAAGGPP